MEFLTYTTMHEKNCAWGLIMLKLWETIMIAEMEQFVFPQNLFKLDNIQGQKSFINQRHLLIGGLYWVVSCLIMSTGWCCPKPMLSVLSNQSKLHIVICESMMNDDGLPPSHPFVWFFFPLVHLMTWLMTNLLVTAAAF